MAKKKAQKKSSRKVPKEPEMQTLPRISVLMANDILKERKKEMAGSANEIDWDPGLEDLWRALVSVYWIYGEQEVKEFLKQEVAAIRKIYHRSGTEKPKMRVVD
jgi:hypothetical protein